MAVEKIAPQGHAGGPVGRDVAGGALVPRLRVAFRGPLTGAVIRGERVVCLVQDRYEAHWKDFWIFEHALADGALLGAILAAREHAHHGRWVPFSAAGDVALAPLAHPLDAFRLSTGARLHDGDAFDRDRRHEAWKVHHEGTWRSDHRFGPHPWGMDWGFRPMRVSLLFDGGARALVQDHRRAEVLGVWDIEAGKRVGELRERMGPVQCAALHADGVRLAVATSSRLRLWDLARGEAVRSVGEVTGRTTSLTFRPDGGAIVACDPRGEVATWDLARGGRPARRAMLARAAAFDVEGDRCAAVALTPLRAAPAEGFDCTLHVWDACTQESLLAQPLAGVHATWHGFQHAPRIVGFLPGGELVVQEHQTLTVFERRALPAPSDDAPDSWRWHVNEHDEEGYRYGFPFGQYGTPVATWRAGGVGWRRVTYEELDAALRPRG